MLLCDLLPGFSLYVSGANYAAWQAQSAQRAPGFARVDLRIVPIDRPDHAAAQNAAMEQFWPAFFDASNVQTVSTDPAP